MKSFRLAAFAVLVAFSTFALAQGHDHKSTDNAPQSEAQKSFAEMKTLAGVWEGKFSTDPPMPEANGATSEVTLRVTSRGNALVHEMKEAGQPDDPAKYDHPLTMFYVDGGQVYLVHYCDAGNRPRMTGTLLPDGKTVDFSFVDVSGPLQHGHMEHAKFTIIDANHHIEEWTYLLPNNTPVHARIDLHRKPGTTTTAAK
jgi:hypothetical protein